MNWTIEDLVDFLAATENPRTRAFREDCRRGGDASRLLRSCQEMARNMHHIDVRSVAKSVLRPTKNPDAQGRRG